MFKNNFTILIALLTFLNVKSQVIENQTSYYFIRHAEKLRDNPLDKDPDLTEKGILRAHKWQEVFKYLQLAEIYTTNFKRTIHTVTPTANLHQLTLTYYNPTTIQIEKFLVDTKNKTVLIVGHSNTIPQFVNSIIGKEQYEEIEDTNNSNLYIVYIKNGVISHHLLKIDIENCGE